MNTQSFVRKPFEHAHKIYSILCQNPRQRGFRRRTCGRYFVPDLRSLVTTEKKGNEREK